VIKNTDHYRDVSARIADYEASIRALVGESTGAQLCQFIKQTSPKIYKDQLAGVIQILGKLEYIDTRLMTRMIERPRLTATQLKNHVETFEKHPDALDRDEGEHVPASPELLSQYASLTNRPEVAT